MTRYVSDFGQVHPLRPYYVPPEDDFVATFKRDLSPSYSHSGYVYHEETPEIGGTNRHETLRSLGKFFIWKYAISAIGNPFELGITLLQVQYLPLEERNLVGEPGIPLEGPDNFTQEDNNQAEDEDDDIDAYFYDPTRGEPQVAPLDPLQPNQTRLKNADTDGYVTRSSVYDDSTRPAYQLPAQEHSIIGMIGAIIKHPSEGIISIFKGLFPGFLFNLGFDTLQPLIAEFLSGILDIPLVDYSRPYTGVLILALSHVIPGLLLSPIDMVRTRLMVQPRRTPHRRYHSAWHCLRASSEEEGSFMNLITKPKFFIPTTLYYSIPIFFTSFLRIQAEKRLGIPRSDPLINRISSLTSATSSSSYTTSSIGRNLTELFIDTAELLVVLPLSTIRKRLQVQVNSSRTIGVATALAVVPYRGCVELRQRPYGGVIDCVYRIITEEGGESVRNKRLVKKSSTDTTLSSTKSSSSSVNLRARLSGLYRGTGMVSALNITLFLLQMLVGEESEGFQDF